MNIKIAIDPIEADFEDCFDGGNTENDSGEAKRDWPFRVNRRGVWRRVDMIDKKTKEITSERRLICSELHVLAETRDADGEEWGRLLKLTDRDGRAKLWAMPMAMLAGDGSAIRDRLYSLGLVPQPSKFAREAVLEYIASATPERKARCIGRIGWTGDAFVLPARTRVVRGEEERIIFQSPAPLADPYRLGGSLHGWQDEVARYAPGNSRLILALSAAFAGPLLFPLATEGGGFHFRGGSSTGKTTLLQVAGSVWGGGGIGGYIRSWRATSNGLEGVAALHCDTLLCLDEIGQINSREAGEVGYMLANGQGKARRIEHFPAEIADFRRFHLNQWQEGAAQPWLALEVYDAADPMTPEAELTGRPCWIGIDLSSVEDLTAMVAVFPDGEGEARRYDVLPHVLPARREHRPEERTRSSRLSAVGEGRAADPDAGKRRGSRRDRGSRSSLGRVLRSAGSRNRPLEQHGGEHRSSGPRLRDQPVRAGLRQYGRAGERAEAGDPDPALPARRQPDPAHVLRQRGGRSGRS